MACPDFEELVRQGAGGHAAECEECRALLDALATVDSRMEAVYSGVRAPAGMAAAVQLRIIRESGPSPLPEVLDFIGWAAILAPVAVLSPRFLPLISAALAKLS